MYRINSTCTNFNIDLKNLKQVLLKNQYPLSMIDDVIKNYLQNVISKTNAESKPVEMFNIKTRYFKLPFIGMYSKVTQKKLKNVVKDFAKMPAINCVRHLRTKILIQVFSVQRLFINFFWASCNASYIGQTYRHLTTKIDEHFCKDKMSHIYQHLMSSAHCLNACSGNCFSILDTARTKHQLRIK